MQAIILAAGMGRRLKALTANNTKCMVKVNGVTLIERMLSQLDRLDLSRIVIVVGYEGQKLIDFIETLSIKTPIIFIDNPIYDHTNNIYSLSLANEYLLEQDTLLLESDLIFEDSVLQTLVDDPRDTLALVDKYESWMDGTVVKLGAEDSIESFVPGKNFKFEDISRYYKTVNIYKFSQHFSQSHYVPFLDAYQKALGENEYYEQVLRVITLLDEPVIRAKRLDGQRWYEIDDLQDLDIAESLFHPDDLQRVALLQQRYGGYWRYPKMLDFCYLVNPYYPPQRLKDEIKASFEILLTQYPSGMRVNSLLAAKNWGVEQKHIVVGNGAAELIKALIEHADGMVGIVRPTFEEYPNRCDPAKLVIYQAPEEKDFRYSADDLMAYFDVHPVSLLAIVNPENPTGNFIEKAELLRLISWAKEKDIRLVVDESFVDFAEEEDQSLLNDEILTEYNGLVVVKSISKSYGVPGLRLGILASADETLISNLKKDVAIWNINSFAEYYLQIAGKFEKDYRTALKKFKDTRRTFISELQAIPGLRVFPSDANYIMCELTDGHLAASLTQELLLRDQILIKDLTSKICSSRQYLRIAVRSEDDNRRLLCSMKKILCK
ncbi:aminotransferase class I/II-fold pyridoxal phosphate-dependent enzyme [Akkermansia muciniphila]|uniref:aminotransferase class I/II-fold pyridoxal phosphate-dependent enzyme n=1 Tax=Akkermansia muciniphila TaxID=239935 RepID=UPI00122F1E0D|nr:aminotransferase class I/II-fold pyridoxal phosphate-dependent enzyme [Akkermansia muciniphila]